MRLAWLVTLCACGRVHFTESARDGDTDVVAPAVGCWAKWIDGPLTLSQPRMLSELSTGVDVGDPWLASDMLTLYFTRGPVNQRDLFVAMRPSRTAMFGTAAAASDLNSPQDDTRVSMTDDGQLAVFSAARTANDFDLYQTTRTGPTFGPAATAPFGGIDDAKPQLDPHISGDGLRVYWAAQLSSSQIIWVASRASRTANFGLATSVGGLAYPTVADPTLSPDERLIVFTGIPTTSTTPHLYYSVRPGSSGSFSAPNPVPNTTSTAGEGDGALSGDGCELFFSSTQSGGSELYVVDVI